MPCLNDTSVSGDFLVLCLGFMIHITSLLIFYCLALVFDTVLEAPRWAGMAPLALAVTLWLDPRFREEQRGWT